MKPVPRAGILGQVSIERKQLVKVTHRYLLQISINRLIDNANVFVNKTIRKHFLTELTYHTAILTF